MTLAGSIRPKLLLSALLLAASVVGLPAGSFFADFNSGLLPANSALNGVSSLAATGGYTNSGCLALMSDLPNQNGAFVLSSDLDGGVAVASFTATFQAFIGSFGNGDNGMSFNFAPDLPAGTVTEEGGGSGLTVEFDSYPNPPEVGATLDVKVAGTEVASKLLPGLRAGEFVQVVIQLNPDHTLDVVYDGTYVYSNLNLNATTPSYTPAAGSRFGFGASTGSLADNVWIDNLSLSTGTALSPFVQSFAPRGRRVSPNSPLDILLTDATTRVKTNTIVLKLDGIRVSPFITTNGTGRTSIHFAPAISFAALSAHTVDLGFADSATPTPHTNALSYTFSVPAQDFTVLFAEGFDGYTVGSLDQNDPAGPNQAPNGGPGNPWFGSGPPNGEVVGAENGVGPHGGSRMVRGQNGGVPAFDQDYCNLAYRFYGGNVFSDNFRLDWWFYDPLGPGGSNYRDYLALVDFQGYPTDQDQDGSGSPGSDDDARLSLGANSLTGADLTKYQAGIMRAADPGIAGSSGWFNTSTSRSIGWHHARIAVGSLQPQSDPEVAFYIDDMVNPTLVHNAITGTGYGFIEMNSQFGSQTGYYDDLSLAVANPPRLSFAFSGQNLLLSWPGGFTLLASDNPNGPYAPVLVNSELATSPFSLDTTSNPSQFFRLGH